MPLAAPEEDYEPEPRDYSDLGDDKEAAYRDPGASNAEAAQRRGAMHGVEGGGEGDGKPQGQLSTAGGPSGDAAASRRAGTEAGGAAAGGAPSWMNQERANKLDQFANQIKKVAGNKKVVFGVAGGGGIVGLIVGGFLLYAQFKVIATMENLERHFGARNNSAVDSRSGLYIRGYIADHLDGAGVRAISNGTASFSDQIYHALWQSGLDSRLQEQGYKIKVRGDPVNPRGKLIEITRDGVTNSYRTLDPAQNTSLTNLVQTQIEPSVIAADESAGKSLWLKRSLYETLGVGSIFDPLRNLSNKASEAKSEFVQGTLEQIYSIPGVGDVLNNVIDKLLGGTADGQQLATQLKAALSGAVGASSVTTTLATSGALSAIVDNTVTKFVTGAGNPFGLAALGLDLGCHGVLYLTSGQFPAEIQRATELTQVGVFQRYASGADETKDGQSVTGASVSAISSTLVSTDSNGVQHDISASNNFKRVNEQAVPYTPSYNCSSYAELCMQKQASQRVTLSTLGQALKAVSDFSTNPLVEAELAPTKGLCTVATAIIDAINSAAGAALHLLLSVIPGANSILSSITGTVGGFIGGAFKAVFGNLITPVVDNTTAGPDLYNAGLVAGASNAYNIAAGSPAGTDQTQAAQSSNPNTCWDAETGNNGNPTNDSLCGHALTVHQVMALDETIENQEISTYQHASFATKIASLSTPYSMFSRLLNAGPATPHEAVTELIGGASAMINPHTWIKFFAEMPNVFTPRLAAAGAGSSSYIAIDNGQGYAMDQVGVTQYGFTKAELANADLDNDGHLHNLDVASACSLVESISVKDSSSTNIDVPQQCLNLLNSGTGGSGSSTTGTGSGSNTAVNGTVADLAHQVLTDSNISFTTSDAK